MLTYWRTARLYGARPLKRAIQQQVENPLLKAILEGSASADSAWMTGHFIRAPGLFH